MNSDRPGAVFSGSGVTGNVTDGFVFDPSQASLGSVIITCSVTTAGGCVGSSTRQVSVRFAPALNFTVSTSCIPVEGGNVAFSNLTGGKLLVETWSWNFDDINSGENNFSILVEPVHFYQQPGARSINLTATTFDGCLASLDLDTVFGGQPVSDFTWTSECVTTGSEIAFVSKSVSGLAQIDTLVYTFRTGAGAVLGEMGSSSLADTVRFPFGSEGSYLVELYTENEGGCYDTVTKQVFLRPTIHLDETGYTEGFDQSQGKWTIESEDGLESWVWDVPDFNGFNPVTGDNAWYTDLPEGTPGYLERSWVQSPCFDFTDMDHPLIRMDL
ncbi:MAG: hypothetical protein EHM46_00005, partial [Bacteroidetes bacterium]